jgi:hypothetical protein
MLSCISLFNCSFIFSFNYSNSSRAFVITAENLENNTNYISMSSFLLFSSTSASAFISNISSSSNSISLLSFFISAGVFISNISSSSDNISLLFSLISTSISTSNISLLLFVYPSLFILLLLISIT